MKAAMPDSFGKAPDAAGSPIEGYYVEVLGQDGTFHALTDCDQGPEALSCLVRRTEDEGRKFWTRTKNFDEDEKF